MTTTIDWTWARFEELSRDALYDALALRCQVFIVEQGPYLDLDGLDRHAWHLLGRGEGGEALAYLRLVDPGCKYPEPSIGRVCIAACARGGGTGRRLMQEGLLRAAQVFPGQANRISAQAHLGRFYESLGYSAVGEAYLEDEIPHREMLWTPPRRDPR